MSDPSIPDHVRTGPDLLERIRELTRHDDAIFWRDLLAAVADELDRERQRVKALEAGLQPFAEYARRVMALQFPSGDMEQIVGRYDHAAKEEIECPRFGHCKIAAALLEVADGR